MSCAVKHLAEAVVPVEWQAAPPSIMAVELSRQADVQLRLWTFNQSRITCTVDLDFHTVQLLGQSTSCGVGYSFELLLG